VSALVTQVLQGLTRGARFNYRSIASLLLVNAHRSLGTGRAAGLRTALHVLVLLEGSLGWVVGGAWTDVRVL